MAGRDAKRQKVAYIAGLVERGHMTCEEALKMSEETFDSCSAPVASSGWSLI